MIRDQGQLHRRFYKKQKDRFVNTMKPLEILSVCDSSYLYLSFYLNVLDVQLTHGCRGNTRFYSNSTNDTASKPKSQVLHYVGYMSQSRDRTLLRD